MSDVGAYLEYVSFRLLCICVSQLSGLTALRDYLWNTRNASGTRCQWWFTATKNLSVCSKLQVFLKLFFNDFTSDCKENRTLLPACSFSDFLRKKRRKKKQLHFLNSPDLPGQTFFFFFFFPAAQFLGLSASHFLQTDVRINSAWFGTSLLI